MQLEDLLDSHVALPSIPRVIAMVLNELNHDEPDLRAISQHINTDVGLATRLLRLANSAQFNLTNKIGSVTDALAVLGLNQVRSLTIAAAVAGAFKHVPGMEMQQFWRYSLDVGKLSRKLARYAKANPSVAFTAGLLHAVGELVMHLGMPDQMRYLNSQVEPLSMRRARAEQHLLGYSYADVGAAFAKNWEFPAAIVNSIQHQNSPFENEVYEPLAGVIHIAAWRARGNEEALGDGDLVYTFPAEVALALNLDMDDVLEQSVVDWTSRSESAELTQ